MAKHKRYYERFSIELCYFCYEGPFNESLPHNVLLQINCLEHFGKSLRFCLGQIDELQIIQE